MPPQHVVVWFRGQRWRGVQTPDVWLFHTVSGRALRAEEKPLLLNISDLLMKLVQYWGFIWIWDLPFWGYFGVDRRTLFRLSWHWTPLSSTLIIGICLSVSGLRNGGMMRTVDFLMGLAVYLVWSKQIDELMSSNLGAFTIYYTVHVYIKREMFLTLERWDYIWDTPSCHSNLVWKGWPLLETSQ